MTSVAVGIHRALWSGGYSRALRRHPLALPSAGWLALVALVALVLPMLYHASYEAIDVTAVLRYPSAGHLFGTDESGRDILARFAYGARVSLVVGLIAASVAVGAGTAVGAVAGHFGGMADTLLMRLTDTMMSIPVFFLLVTILALFGSTLTVLVLGIGATTWMDVARVVRSEILRHGAMEYVTAARAVGASEARVLVIHLLPQATSSIIVAAVLAVAQAILTESALSYLGLGVQAPLPSWGNMLSSAQDYIYLAPQLALYPGIAIMLTVLALNLLGNAVRDMLDPRTERRVTRQFSRTATQGVDHANA